MVGKATVSMSLETILKIVIVIAFVLAAILLIYKLQQTSLERLSLLDPITFFKNILFK